ncbi:MAG TPA: NADP-dependent oxidoreductase [Pseudonocardiaceae bacterium]|jgi:NADPH:quinone reductase-like Zn-dependent oxidoreductase|nr:NADP-dependent oxidoreductase [Pseudonocardiaceae bacterium]
MWAITFSEFGGPDVLRLTEVDAPHPGTGQVRIRVLAAGVNPIDHKIREGWLEAMSPTVLPSTPGSEVAGVVDEIGVGVADLAVGDEVFGWSNTGGYAEHALATVVVSKPAEVGWAEAAALPVAGGTAWRVLDQLVIVPGDTLLVHGAAGAVGSMAVQLAIHRGATVIGTARVENHDYLRELGATPVTYGERLVERVRAAAPQGVDAVFDAAGRDALGPSIELRGGTDRVITIADPKAAEFRVPFSTGGPETRGPTVLTELADLVADGRLQVTVAAEYPLAAAADAQQQSQQGHTRGKIVLLPGER